MLHALHLLVCQVMNFIIIYPYQTIWFIVLLYTHIRRHYFALLSSASSIIFSHFDFLQKRLGQLKANSLRIFIGWYSTSLYICCDWKVLIETIIKKPRSPDVPQMKFSVLNGIFLQISIKCFGSVFFFFIFIFLQAYLPSSGVF